MGRTGTLFFQLPLVAAVLLVLAACATTAPSPGDPPPAGTADLTVLVHGAANDRGGIAVALYASAQAFAEGARPMHAAILPIVGGEAVWRIGEIASGIYAVKAYHDLDGDGALDRGPMGAPTEPYGFSNDARGRLGPPSFEAAAFVVAPGALEIEIEVR